MVMLFLLAVLAVICSCERSQIDNFDWECETANHNLDRNLNNLGLDNSIVITFNNEDELIIDNPYENEISIALNEGNVIVQNLSFGTEYNLVVGGTTENGSLKIYGNQKMGLYLNGVNIANPNGPAINIQNRQKMSIHLVNGTENYLADGSSYGISGEDAKGTFFSEAPIYFFGCGALAVVGKYAHAIAVDNDFEIGSGIITVVEAARDGIHANGDIYARGGNIYIASSGEGIQSENSSVHISGGKTAIKTTGIKSHGIKANNNMEISDGVLIIRTSGADSKGINVDGNLTVTGGDIKINAIDDGIKVHGNLLINAGNFCVWSLKKQNIDCVGTETIKEGTVNNGSCAIGF